MPDQDDVLRAVAGLLLKNNVRDYYKRMSPDVRQYIKEEVIRLIGDQKTMIRRTVGTILTTIIEVGTLKECPGLLRLFLQLLSTNDFNLIDGTLGALYKICQDSADQLYEDNERAGRPLEELFPKLFAFFGSEHEPFRRFALGCVNQFLICMPPVLLTHFDTYMKVRHPPLLDPLTRGRDHVGGNRVCSRWHRTAQRK
jgi:hypothetical protein